MYIPFKNMFVKRKGNKGFSHFHVQFVANEPYVLRTGKLDEKIVNVYYF